VGTKRPREEGAPVFTRLADDIHDATEGEGAPLTVYYWKLIHPVKKYKYNASFSWRETYKIERDPERPAILARNQVQQVMLPM